jgi:hypothetical protein
MYFMIGLFAMATVLLAKYTVNPPRFRAKNIALRDDFAALPRPYAAVAAFSGLLFAFLAWPVICGLGVAGVIRAARDRNQY